MNVCKLAQSFRPWTRAPALRSCAQHLALVLSRVAWRRRNSTIISQTEGQCRHGGEVATHPMIAPGRAVACTAGWKHTQVQLHDV